MRFKRTISWLWLLPLLLATQSEAIAKLSGYIDKTGKIVVKPQFAHASMFSEGLAAAAPPASDPFSIRYGYIDKSGSFVIPPQFEDAGDFSEGLAHVKKNGKSLFIDKTGKVIIDPHDSWTGLRFSEGLVSIGIRQSDRCGYMDGTGGVIITPQFDHCEEFSEGLAVVNIESKYGFIDKAGRMVRTLESHFITPPMRFFEGLVVVRLRGDDHFSFIDKTGRVVIDDRQFKAAERFSEGLAVVGIKPGKWYYIDRTGQRAIKQSFLLASTFSDGLAMVWLPKLFSIRPRICFIDRNGKVVLNDLKFETVGPFSEGLAVAEELSGG
jgi:hypothetical protein